MVLVAWLFDVQVGGGRGGRASRPGPSLRPPPPAPTPLAAARLASHAQPDRIEEISTLRASESAPKGAFKGKDWVIGWVWHDDSSPFGGEFVADTGHFARIVEGIKGVNCLFMGQSGELSDGFARNPAFSGLNNGQNPQPMGACGGLLG